MKYPRFINEHRKILIEAAENPFFTEVIAREVYTGMFSIELHFENCVPMCIGKDPSEKFVEECVADAKEFIATIKRSSNTGLCAPTKAMEVAIEHMAGAEERVRDMLSTVKEDGGTVSLPYKKNDPVNHPKHYTQGKIECADFIADQNLDFFDGNVVKYVVRHRHKNGVEDLKKARWYLDRKIQLLEGVASSVGRTSDSKSED